VGGGGLVVLCCVVGGWVGLGGLVGVGVFFWVVVGFCGLGAKRSPGAAGAKPPSPSRAVARSDIKAKKKGGPHLEAGGHSREGD